MVVLREWLGKVGVKTLHIEPEDPWESGHFESFNGKRRDELRNGEMFYQGADREAAEELQLGDPAQHPGVHAVGTGGAHPRGGW